MKPLPQVTDMAWGPAGNVYISDGYINSRVAKADKNGTGSNRGHKGASRANSPRRTASRRCAGNIYVADRGNRRIQVFDGDGNLLPRDDDRRAL